MYYLWPLSAFISVGWVLSKDLSGNVYLHG